MPRKKKNYDNQNGTKENKIQELAPSNFKIYSKATIIKMGCQW
jgi:hypothetical protein